MRSLLCSGTVAWHVCEMSMSVSGADEVSVGWIGKYHRARRAVQARPRYRSHAGRRLAVSVPCRIGTAQDEQVGASRPVDQHLGR
jgi:hypothetical protein